MISLRVNGNSLVLPADAEAQLELINPSLSDTIEDSFTLPMELPVEGNEEFLEHVAELAIGNRKVTFPDAELIHEGVRLHSGSLDVIGSSPHAVRCSFRVDGFIAEIKGKKLRDLTIDEPITVADLRTHAEDMNNGHWPAKTHAFPMYFNPEIYGSSNPNWYPDAPTWSATNAYAVNDLVTFSSGAPVRKTWRYQCTSATVAGESPTSHPAKWRKTAFGIVNAWNHTTSEFYVNDGVSEHYTMVPWFYLKYIVQQTLAALGYRPAGEWWIDGRYNRRMVINHNMLDISQRTHYFLAHQTGGAVVVTGTPFGTGNFDTHALPCDDDSTAPNQDSDGVWDTTTFKWTCPGAGKYVFRFRVPPTFPPSDTVKYCGLARDGTPDTDLVFSSFSSFDPPGWSGIVGFMRTFSAGDTGNTFFPFATDSLGQPITLENCWVEGWKMNESISYPQNDVVIDPRDHMPDVTIDELLLALRDTYGLHITVDRQTKEVRMDYMQTKLAQLPKEWSDRLAGLIEIDHQRRVRGIKYLWDVVPEDLPDLENMTIQGEYNKLEDVPVPDGPGMYCIVQNSRMILVSQIVSGDGLIWVIKSHDLDEVLVGEEEDATSIQPTLGPMLTALVSILGEEFVIPWISEKGNSRFYPTAREEASFRCADYFGMEANANLAVIPYASSWGLGLAGSSIDATMNWPDSKSPYDVHWKKWAAMRVKAEPVITSVLLDHPCTMAREYDGPVVMGNQHYIPERLPISYGRGPLLSEGAELLRINPAPE